MKKKETIQTLIDFNKWRRGGEGEQPDPKIIGDAIDIAISTLEEKGGFISYRDSYKKKYEDTQPLLDFANMQIEILYNYLDEIESMTTDPLTRSVARMAKEIHQTNKLIHSRLILN